MALLYARQVLMSLLADWSSESQEITADLIGCKDDGHVPFVLDLLNSSECKETFHKVSNLAGIELLSQVLLIDVCFVGNLSVC